jgi:hypothetical protein
LVSRLLNAVEYEDANDRDNNRSNAGQSFFRQLHFFIRFLFLAGLTGQLVSTITK